MKSDKFICSLKFYQQFSSMFENPQIMLYFYCNLWIVDERFCGGGRENNTIYAKYIFFFKYRTFFKLLDHMN
jgi:hypothetical protein